MKKMPTDTERLDFLLESHCASIVDADYRIKWFDTREQIDAAILASKKSSGRGK